MWWFKQKTAYELRISDWSSDVCSSDLLRSNRTEPVGPVPSPPIALFFRLFGGKKVLAVPAQLAMGIYRLFPDRKRVVEGKSVSVRVDLGGRRIIKNKITAFKPSDTMYEKKSRTAHTTSYDTDIR